MNNLKKQGIRGEIFLTITAIIWGTSFVVQKVSLDYVGPFTFVALRFLLGALFLFPVALFLNWIKQKNAAAAADDRSNTEKEAFLTKPTLLGGAACGLALFLAASFQQNGLIYTA